MGSAAKAIVLTGVSGGLGFETAKAFAENGYAVFGLDIKEPPAAIEGLTFIQTDITKQEQVLAAFDTVQKTGAKLDAIISAAGIYELDSLLEMSEEAFIRVFDINAFSIFRVNKAFLPLLKKSGKMIMVSSELGPLDPLPFTGIYGISKTLIEKYAYSLRMEAQLLGYQVVLVRPGAIDTGLLNVSQTKLDRFVETTALYKTNSRRFKRIVGNVESKKVAPAKVANLIYRINGKEKPRYVYKINRNLGLLLLNAMPQHFQNWIIKRILTSKEKS